MFKGEKAILIAAFEKSDVVEVDVENTTIQLSSKERSKRKLQDKERSASIGVASPPQPAESTATELLAVGGGSCLWPKRRNSFGAHDSREESGESGEMQELYSVRNETDGGENPRRNSTTSNVQEVL